MNTLMDTRHERNSTLHEFSVRVLADSGNKHTMYVEEEITRGSWRNHKYVVKRGCHEVTSHNILVSFQLQLSIAIKTPYSNLIFKSSQQNFRTNPIIHPPAPITFVHRLISEKEN